MEEIFDVVDERDQVIGQERRSEVHRMRLRHRAVHVLVFNAQGELFLQKRSVRKDSAPGQWDSSASGHLESGESYDPCAVRELREELGLEVAEVPRRLFRVEASEETGHEFVWVYRLEAEGPFVWDREEIEGGDWFEEEVISEWIEKRPEELARSFRWIWGRYLEWRRTGTGGG